ncbi:hypothetical protein [Streptomyces sp. NPDC005533]|uniref:hypothetical protein n=1 Tax=Streptomyces sp. NPDC005533 TaxID=3364723 RepID=UPI00367C1FA3
MSTKDPRVSVRLMQGWRHAWHAGGSESFSPPRGPTNSPVVTGAQFTGLRRNPAVHGFAEERLDMDCAAIDGYTPGPSKEGFTGPSPVGHVRRKADTT